MITIMISGEEMEETLMFKEMLSTLTEKQKNWLLGFLTGVKMGG